MQSLNHYAVGRIEALGMSDDKTAKSLLEKVAWQVQPIMQRRKFQVPLLSEMFPQQSNLMGLNINGGGGSTSEIRLRLRKASSSSTFLHYESILATMLHELAHNHHGPHAAPFYKLLDELRAECEELVAKGVGGSGSGFDARSEGKLGGRNAGRELSSFDRRQAAALAAEQRAKRQALMSSGPQKVGGSSSGLRDLPPALAAAAAAERRLKDNTWCPTELLNEQAAGGGKDDDDGGVHAALQAILDGRFSTKSRENNNKNDGNNNFRKPLPPPLPEPSSVAVAAAGSAALYGEKKRNITIIEEVEGVIDLTGDDDEDEERKNQFDGGTTMQSWICPACTFINTNSFAVECEICATTNPYL